MDDVLKIIDSTLRKRFSDPVNEDLRDTLVLRRSIKLLNAILKEFSTAKMPNIIRAMGAVSYFNYSLNQLDLPADTSTVPSRVLGILSHPCFLGIHKEPISWYNFAAGVHRHFGSASDIQVYRKTGPVAVESPWQRRKRWD